MFIIRTRSVATAACAAVAVLLMAVPRASAERLNDKDVKQLIERIDNDRDRFEDQLDGTLKRSVIRNPTGEVNVEGYLHDLQENVSKLQDRFKPAYSASAEATTVLRQGSEIKRYMVTLPAAFDGKSEWNRLDSSLGELAAAYGTPWPLPDGQQARRLNDQEVKIAAGVVADNADHFKKELDSSLKADKSIDKVSREAAVKEADLLKGDAKNLGSVVGDGRPASSEAQALFQRAAGMKTAAAGRALSPAAQTAWTSVESSLGTVAQAFGLPGLP